MSLLAVSFPELLTELKNIGVEELCPKGVAVNAEAVKAWHAEGFRVRAWGVTDTGLMEGLYDDGVDGMTVNFPDRLTAYIEKKN